MFLSRTTQKQVKNNMFCQVNLSKFVIDAFICLFELPYNPKLP